MEIKKFFLKFPRDLVPVLNTKDQKIESDRIFLSILYQRQMSYQRKKSIPLKIRFYPIFRSLSGTKSSEKNGKKVEKKFFLSIYPGLKSEFLRPKTFLKNFIYAFKTPV